jgi:hypothetical protein
VGTVLPGVLAGVVPSDGFGEGAVVDGTHRALRTGREAAVVTLAEPPPVLVDYSVSGRACVVWGFSFLYGQTFIFPPVKPKIQERAPEFRGRQSPVFIIFNDNPCRNHGLFIKFLAAMSQSFSFLIYRRCPQKFEIAIVRSIVKVWPYPMQQGVCNFPLTINFIKKIERSCMLVWRS